MILSAIWWAVRPSISRAYSCSPDFLKKASGVPKRRNFWCLVSVSTSHSETADQRMLFDGRDQLEAAKGIGQALLVERLHGVEADDFGGDALLLQQMRGLDDLGQHVAGREQADIGAFGDRDRLADLEVGDRALVHHRFALLAHPDIDRAVLLHGRA